MQTEVEIARMQEEIANLKEWQRTQNGALGGLKTELEKMRERFENRFEVLNGRLIAILSSSLVALLLLVLNLAIGKL